MSRFRKESAVPLSLKDVVTSLTDAGFHPIGYGEAFIAGVSSFARSRPNTVTFWKSDVSPTNAELEELSVGVLVLAKPLIAEGLAQEGFAAIGVTDPRTAFAFISAQLNPPSAATGIHSSVVVHSTAQIHATASIGIGSVIGPNCVIGAHCRLGSYCIIHPQVTIGSHVEIGDLTVVGAPGFGYVSLPTGKSIRVPHSGSVRIETAAHIGSHVAIDRGTIDDTVIGAGARIDNLVHIAHNVHIGAGALVIAGAEISGGVVVGEGAWIAPQVAIREQLVIGAGAVVGIGSVVLRDVLPGEVVAGVPARELPPRP